MKCDHPCDFFPYCDCAPNDGHVNNVAAPDDEFICECGTRLTHAEWEANNGLCDDCAMLED